MLRRPKRPRLARAIFAASAIAVLGLSTACARRAASTLERLVPFDANARLSLAPESIFGQDRGDYSLVYVLAPDGSSVRLRYLGPSEALSAGFHTIGDADGDEHAIVGVIGVPGAGGIRVVLARWRLDEERRVRDARVRTEPVVEIRPSRSRDPAELVGPCEWRPWVDGRGVGTWRR